MFLRYFLAFSWSAVKFLCGVSRFFVCLLRVFCLRMEMRLCLCSSVFCASEGFFGVCKGFRF